MHLLSRYAGVGICLKAKHYDDILTTRPAIGWLEVHSENYLGRGGPSLVFLESIRQHYPISLHGVSLSLGSSEPLDQNLLQQLKALIGRIDPILVSEHLSWSRMSGHYMNDLLPLPYTQETLDIVCANIDQTQEFLGRKILIENPSAYIAFKDSTMEEPDFLTQIAHKTGCQLLFDVNNIYVSGNNNDFSPQDYIQQIDPKLVGEIHLAGHARRQIGEHTLLIDDHGSRVCDDVWNLYKKAIERFGPVSTLIEWDADVPTLEVLVEEAHKAQGIIQQQGGCDVAVG